MANIDNDAVRHLAATGPSRVVLTCEHASNRLPSPWTWPDADRWIADTHWAWDPGAAELTSDLAAILGSCSVLAQFTRLLCDANRHADPSGATENDEPNLFRTVAEGHPVALNTAVDAAERDQRLSAYHQAYHAAVDAACRDNPGDAILAIHTFTPVYEGEVREVEIGVLFDEEADVAADWAVAMSDRGLQVWLNEPYSGTDGLIYSASRHGRAHGRRVLELEVRNDLATDPEWRKINAPKIAAALLEALEGAVE
jgi:predicted N-formylglutamate amidohydrolase